MRICTATVFCLLTALSFSEQTAPGAEPPRRSNEAKNDNAKNKEAWTVACRRGEIYAECAGNVRRLLQGWIDLKQDPQTGLFSRGRTWDYHNEAADHYSSLVLMAYYVAPEMNRPGGTLHRTLTSSQTLCKTPSGLPTTYNLKAGARGPVAEPGHLSEWLRDGLIRICEAMGRDNDWYREMTRLTDAMLADAKKRGGMDTAFRGTEPKGSMLQTLARLYAMSGNEEYFDAADELAASLLADPAETAKLASFRDHGCELLPGLAEFFVVAAKTHPAKAARYRDTMRELLDRVMETSAHPETGLLCSFKRTPDGKKIWRRSPDTWGYVLFGYENYDRATGENRYRAAVEKPMRWLTANRSRYEEVRDSLWPIAKSADDWSDSYESMIVLSKRCPSVQETFEWLDWATKRHRHRRHTDPKYGCYTGDHFDGSTGRTLCIHMMLCSEGIHVSPFQEGLQVGAVQHDGGLLVTAKSDRPWKGRLHFDGPRAEFPTATIDWARINEMPQWFVVRPEKAYMVGIGGETATVVRGEELIAGLPARVGAGETLRIRLQPTDD